METTVGQVIINDMLPEDMRDYNRTWDKKTKGKVLTDLARRHPDQFKEVSHNLLRFGAKAAYETGGQSFGIEDIAPTQISRDFQRVMGQQLQDILVKAYKKGKTSQDPEVQQEIADAAIPWMKKIDDGINEELGWENPFYRQAYGTGAQKPGTLRSIVGADVFYVDQNNKRVPIPVTHGYAQGLTPAEYFIQSFGTRKGMVDLQKATQDAGFLCLARGSQVRMADMSVKQIEHIKEGDWVLGIEDDLDNPKGKPVQVTHLFDNGIRNCYKTVFAGDTTLISTLRHKILANNKNEHNEIIPVGASKELKAITIQGKSIPIKEQKVMGRLHTYDIEVNSPNHLFVLANGLIVSNSKQLVQIAHRLVVTDKDDDTAFAPQMPVGYPVSTDDPDNEGSCLAEDIGGYKRNTLLTPKILGDLKNRGFDKILIRSVMVGGPANGGVYSLDCGVRESGSLPNKGDFVGINAVQAISEPLTQGAISSKHSGGVAGADSGKAISGFKFINQLIQVPKHFPGGAVHSELDGTVTKIEDAPQGGKYIYVNGEKHYVGRSDEKDIPITVKVGDRVEAGDVLTEGIPNPAMIVKYKGIGEGRRYFTKMFRDALNNAGVPSHRRNVEMLSRGLINYVKLTDEVGDYAPDDILPYSMIEKDYQPREDAKTDNPESMEGYYLEKPVLHYSIGTKLRPSVIKELREFGIKRVVAHKDPPPFEAEMVRGMAHVSKDPDWATRLLGAYNKDSLLEGARRGATSSAESTSYVPAITFGEGDFGHIGPLKQGSVKQADMIGDADPFGGTNSRDNMPESGFIVPTVNPFPNIPPKTTYTPYFTGDKPFNLKPKAPHVYSTTQVPHNVGTVSLYDNLLNTNNPPVTRAKLRTNLPKYTKNIIDNIQKPLSIEPVNYYTKAKEATNTYDMMRNLAAPYIAPDQRIGIANLNFDINNPTMHPGLNEINGIDNNFNKISHEGLGHYTTLYKTPWPRTNPVNTIKNEGNAYAATKDIVNKAFSNIPTVAEDASNIAKYEGALAVNTYFNGVDQTKVPNLSLTPYNEPTNLLKSEEGVNWFKNVTGTEPTGNTWTDINTLENSKSYKQLHSKIYNEATQYLENQGIKPNNWTTFKFTPELAETSLDIPPQEISYWADPVDRAAMINAYRDAGQPIPDTLRYGYNFSERNPRNTTKILPERQIEWTDFAPKEESPIHKFFRNRTKGTDLPRHILNTVDGNYIKAPDYTYYDTVMRPEGMKPGSTVVWDAVKESPLKRVGRVAGKMITPAFAYYYGYPDAKNVTNNISDWTYNFATKYGIPEEQARQLSDGAYTAILPEAASISAMNQYPRVYADFTVAAPTDLANLGIMGTNALGFTNWDYLPRPETENLTVANAIRHPLQFAQDAAKATYTGIDNIHPGKYDIQNPVQIDYPEGIDPNDEEDMALYNQMADLQEKGLCRGLDYMYMSGDEQSKWYFQYEDAKQYYTDVVNRDKEALTEAKRQGLTNIDTIKQQLEQDQHILNQIRTELYALQKVSPTIQRRLYYLNGGVPVLENTIPPSVIPTNAIPNTEDTSIQDELDDLFKVEPAPPVTKEEVHRWVNSILDNQQ